VQRYVRFDERKESLLKIAPWWTLASSWVFVFLFVSLFRRLAFAPSWLVQKLKTNLMPCCLPTSNPSDRRGMAGFPASFGVKKNKYVEEWNGKREITEKTFGVEFSSAPTLFFYLVVVPYGIYTWSRSELINSGDRRYKDVV
jgi:hypothetical protein